MADRALAARRVGVAVKGPAEAPIAFLRGQARWQVWLGSADRAALAATARAGARPWSCPAASGWRSTSTRRACSDPRPVYGGVSRETVDGDPCRVL